MTYRPESYIPTQPEGWSEFELRRHISEQEQVIQDALATIDEANERIVRCNGILGSLIQNKAGGTL